MGFTLTRANWQTFKTTNNLSKSSWFSKADVGPTIDKFHVAYAAWKKQRGLKSLMECSKRADDLKKAFEKFIALKETRNEMTPTAKTQIEAWHTQLGNLGIKLAVVFRDNEKELKEKDAELMHKLFVEDFGL